ncbi:MAG: MerR family transcriptional regulator [Bacillota bacterium]|nr:MerR family transcriptional regulator [Bacillota bacterium]MDW7684557.1 MerR family transcriptional regulator [Bacillota bacterium]
MFKIGEFSGMNKVTVKTLRHYDQIGLLKPARVDGDTGYRYYTAGQLPRLHKILALRQIGFSLSEVILAMDNDVGTEELARFLKRKQVEVTRTIVAEREKLRCIEKYLKALAKEEDGLAYHVIVKELPEVIVASMRKVIPNYDAYFQIYPEMGKLMEEQNVKCAVPEYCFTIYHDGEYKETDIDVEICEAVTDFGRDTDNLKFKKIAGEETAASVVHKGPYTTIGLAYAAIMEWIEENGYELSGPPRESYIDGIWNKEDPAEWVTEIQVPVTPKKN